MNDMLGFPFTEGCKVARAVLYGKSPMIDICVVTRIENGRLYLDNSKAPMKIPDRLLIIEQDRLTRMVLDYEKEQNG